MRIPLVLAISVILLSIACDTYIYCDIRKNFGSRKLIPRAYAISSFCCWAFLIVCLLLPRRDASADITFLMWAFYSYITIYLAKTVFLIFSLIGLIPMLWHSRSWKLGKWLGLPLALLLFCSMWWGAAVTRKNIDIVKANVNSPKLPGAFNGYKIVQISDLHVGTWGEDTRFISRLVDSINSQHPDIVFFTGDIVNRETRELEPFLQILSHLKAPDGVWSVLGNHDYGDYMEWSSPKEKEDNLRLLKSWQRQIGWRLLNNESVEIVHQSDTIHIIGVENWGEPPFHQYGHLIDAYPSGKGGRHNLKDSRFKILLTHNPEHWRREVSDISNIDLTLSGHTHAWQTILRLGKLRWSPSAFRYPQWGGLYINRNPEGELLQLYVNIGAGEVGMPFRIGAPPEITVITLHKDSIPYSLQPK